MPLQFNLPQVFLGEVGEVYEPGGGADGGHGTRSRTELPSNLCRCGMPIAFAARAACGGFAGTVETTSGGILRMADGSNDNLVSIGDGSVSTATMDLRGWGVVAGDGTWLGNVGDVLLDRDSGEPHYIAVALEPSVARQPGGRPAYVRASEARLDPAARRVHLDGVEGTLAHLMATRPGDQAGVAPSPLTAAVAAQAPSTIPAAEGEVRMQLAEEELEIGKRIVGAGEVRVHKRVQTQQVREVVPVTREDVTVERRPLAEGAGLEPRQEGDTWFIPIVEEELVIQKRLVAREELVIRKRQVVEEQVVEETLRRETPEVLGPGDAPLDDDPRVP
jgi:uncharacterized protein (TIGR02271 family)